MAIKAIMVIGIKGNDCPLACIPYSQDRSDHSGMFTLYWPGCWSLTKFVYIDNIIGDTSDTMEALKAMMVIGIKGNDCPLACIPDGRQDRSDQSGIFTGPPAANQGPFTISTYYAMHTGQS